jgi:hypothetical protein
MTATPRAADLGAVFSFFIASEQLPKLEAMVRRFPKVRSWNSA